MIAQNGRGDNVAQFSVRQSINNRAPRHTQLTFRKYGDTEFLTKVYEGGRTDGHSRYRRQQSEEKRLIGNGQHGVETDEDQP